MAQPIRMEICCTILMPVWRACQDFLLLHTAFRKGSNAGIPNADATTAKARAVVLRTYSSMLSMSGRIVDIIVAKPAAYKIIQACRQTPPSVFLNLYFYLSSTKHLQSVNIIKNIKFWTKHEAIVKNRYEPNHSSVMFPCNTLCY